MRVAVVAMMLGATVAQMVGANPAAASSVPANASVTVNYPASTSVGQNLNPTITITNPADGATATMSNIQFAPSCDNAVFHCSGGVESPDVFTLGGSGTGTGTACPGTAFTITESPSGVFNFSPSVPMIPGQTCTISFVQSTLRVPSNDVDVGVPGVQTNGVASATEGTATGISGFDEITVDVATTHITTQATQTALVGGSVTDTATLTGGVNPTGTILFQAYTSSDCDAGHVYTSNFIPVTGNGNYTSTPAYIATAPGTIYWVASYSGDANNSFANSSCEDATEHTMVSKVTPTVTTTASGSVPLGGQISDQATISGGANPGGTITFRAYGPDDATCANSPVFVTAAIPVSGNGSYPSVPVTPGAKGTYRWIASYVGDANNNDVPGACNSPSESVVVSQANTSIRTTASGSVQLGGQISDSALLTGGFNPTGQITFQLFGPNNPTCAGQPLTSSTKTVTGNSTYASDPYTINSAGSFSWVATYGGDMNNNPAGPTACTDAAESVSIPKANPTLTTNAVASAVVGTTISDNATISGGFNPTGSVTFKLYDNSTCTDPPAFISSPVPVNGNGTVNSGNFTPTAVKDYHWVATYSSDANNNGAGPTPCADPAELTSVIKASPGISTLASGDVIVGNNISDTATISGGFNVVHPSVPFATVTFTLYNNQTCTEPNVVSSTVPVDVANPSSTSFPTTATGTYYWIASYSGDANNNPASTACQDPGESVNVLKATPVISTDASRTIPAGGPVSDRATIAQGFNPTGTLTFNLYGPNDLACQGAPVFSSPVPVNGNGVYSSGTFNTVQPGTYKWAVSYSSDANNNAASSPCNSPFETVVVTPQVMTGRAYGAKVDLLAPLLPPTPDTGPVSTTQAGDFSTPCVVNANPILNAGVLCADVTTSTSPPSSTATATVANANILTGISGVPAISVTAVKAVSTSDCSGSTGTTTIANLTIAGAPVDVSNLAPNTTINLNVAVLTLNEQIPVAGADHGLTVNAVHLVVPSVADIVLASATSDIHNCFPPVVQPSLPVFAGYADKMRQPPFAPTPWMGSPNTAWVGDDVLNLVDSGAVRIDNPTGVPIDGVKVTVDVGSHHFDLWGVNSIPANGHLVLFQTVPLISFDTSDAEPGASCTASSIIPIIHVSAYGVTRDYQDFAQALTSHGVDRGDCFGQNEGVEWTPATVVPFGPSHNVVTDFDGDNRTDASVFRRSSGTWFDRPSSGGPDTAVNYGANGDIPVPGDYDGDNHTDVAIYRPSVGLWAIHNSLSGTDTFVTYGVSTDIPVPADYDGDGKVDIAVFRPSFGTWFVHRSSDNTDMIVTFGIPGDVAVAADFTGDGKADIAVYRAGNWFIRPSEGGPFIGMAYGAAGDVPVIGDYDGDLRTDIAIFRPATGLWALHLSAGGDVFMTYGISTDIPVPGDYDGDTRTDIAVFRPSVGTWYAHRSSDGTDFITTFGISSDTTLQLPPAVRLAFYP